MLKAEEGRKTTWQGFPRMLPVALKSGWTWLLTVSRMPRWARLAAGPAVAIAVGIVTIRVFAPDLTGTLAQRWPGADGGLWLGLAVATLAVILLSDAGSLAVLVRAVRPGVPFWAGAAVSIESRLVEGATSFGGLEVPFQVVRLRRLGLSTPEASAAVVVKGLLRVSVLLALAATTLMPGLASPLSSLQRSIILGCLAAVVAVWTGAWLFFGRRRDRLVPRRLRAKVDEARQHGRLMCRGGWGPLVWSATLQALNWAATLALVPLILRALGWQGPVLPIVLAQAVLPFVVSLSPLPGGAGMAELGYLQFVGGLLPPEVGLASLAVWRLMTWVVPTMLGAVAIGVSPLVRVAVGSTATTDPTGLLHPDGRGVDSVQDANARRTRFHEQRRNRGPEVTVSARVTA